MSSILLKIEKNSVLSFLRRQESTIEEKYKKVTRATNNFLQGFKYLVGIKDKYEKHPTKNRKPNSNHHA